MWNQSNIKSCEPSEVYDPIGNWRVYLKNTSNTPTGNKSKSDFICEP